jgi:hypothetical protein
MMIGYDRNSLPAGVMDSGAVPKMFFLSWSVLWLSKQKPELDRNPWEERWEEKDVNISWIVHCQYPLFFLIIIAGPVNRMYSTSRTSV